MLETIAADVSVLQATESRQVFGRLLEDRRLPEQRARSVAPRPVDLAQALVQLPLLFGIFAGADLLQERI